MVALEPYRFFPEHVAWLNSDLMRYSEQRHRVHTEQSVRGYADSVDYFWSVVADNTVVGTVAATVDHPNDIVDLGMLIGQPGKGYGREAWKRALEYLKARHRKVVAGAMAVNVPMVRIMQHTMKYEYRRPGYFLFNGSPVDSVHYGV